MKGSNYHSITDSFQMSPAPSRPPKPFWSCTVSPPTLSTKKTSSLVANHCAKPDIFGFFDQTIQGADILATSNEQKYRVFMPDFFEGSFADISWYPPTTDEHKERLGNFFKTKAAPPNTLSKIPNVV